MSNKNGYVAKRKLRYLVGANRVSSTHWSTRTASPQICVRGDLVPFLLKLKKFVNFNETTKNIRILLENLLTNLRKRNI